jgi:hypothetical protein
MSVYDQAIAKMRLLPDSLVQEVNAFIDFLLWKHSGKDSSLWFESKESIEMAESDFSDYLSNLEDYENRLAGGEM